MADNKEIDITIWDEIHIRNTKGGVNVWFTNSKDDIDGGGSEVRTFTNLPSVFTWLLKHYNCDTWNLFN